MERTRPLPPVPYEWDDGDHDQVVVLRGITWEQYVAISDAQSGPQPRMAYLDGELEIMTTSSRHEVVKKLLGRLLEAYAEERNIALNGYGMTTWRNESKWAAAEADECYAVGPLDEVPHLAIEVVHTSGGIDKLEVCRRLGVREVWFWINGHIYAYHLVGKYEEIETSIVIPGLELEALARIIASTDEDEQTEAVRAYRKSLQRATGSTSR